MSVLRNLEAKLEAFVEGAFSRAFKSRVQPVELARKLAKEMEENQADYGHTMVYSPDAEARKLVETPALGRALLVSNGRRTVLSGARVVVGRSRDCDVVLDDPNVSRRHAELRRQGDTWMVADLGSTNGVKVNGRRVEHAVLKAGDEITLGLSRLSFEQE